MDNNRHIRGHRWAQRRNCIFIWKTRLGGQWTQVGRGKEEHEQGNNGERWGFGGWLPKTKASWLAYRMLAMHVGVSFAHWATVPPPSLSASKAGNPGPFPENKSPRSQSHLASSRAEPRKRASFPEDSV